MATLLLEKADTTSCSDDDATNKTMKKYSIIIMFDSISALMTLSLSRLSVLCALRALPAAGCLC